MPANPNKLSQFWQELKRRKVIKVIAMYAGGAYVVIELANNVVAPLNLPEWTPRLVIILALVGFPLTVIFSWIFDITSGGITRTESVNVLPKEKPTSKSLKRRLKASDAIIIVLVIVVGILVYPRIFKGSASLNAMTKHVIVVNEFGEEEIHRVFKDPYIAKLALFPFVNESKDTLENWLSYGIFEVFTEELQQFGYLSLFANEYATHLQEKINFAETNGFPRFLTGVYKVEDNEYEITARIYQTSNGTILSERTYRGNDFFSLADSMSLQVRIDLGIPKHQINSSPDLPSNELLTNNFDAFRYYVKGYYIDSFYTYSQKAIELDTTFTLALYSRAAENHKLQACNESAKKDINQAMRHRQRLAEYREIFTRILYYSINGDNEKAIALLERQYELQPNNIQLLHEIIFLYERNFKIHKFEEAVQQLNKSLPGVPRYQIRLARSYLLTGKPNKGLKVLNKLLKNSPNHTVALLLMGEIYLHLNDLAAAENVIRKAILLSPEDQMYWSRILSHIDYVRSNHVDNDFLLPFTGNYRFEGLELDLIIFIHNNHLLAKAENQRAVFRYPISDNQSIYENGFQSDTYIYNELGYVDKYISELRDLPDPLIVWKEDSLILKAKRILKEGNHTKALLSFKSAYIKNPEHYYLANFISHLELVLSSEYEVYESVFNSYLGEYGGDMTIYKENNHYYFIDKEVGFIDKILPISKGKFMFPSLYDRQIHMIKKNNAITGLKTVYTNGDEKFYPRISEQDFAN